MPTFGALGTPVAKSQVSTSGTWVWGDMPVGSYSNATTPASKNTTATAAPVMGGYGWLYTPAKSGILLIHVRGQMSNGTTGDGARVVGLFYGTGTAPLNGAAATGTQALPADPTGIDNSTGVAAGWLPFSLNCYTPILTLAQRWFDLQILALTGGTATFDRVVISWMEISA